MLNILKTLIFFPFWRRVSIIVCEVKRNQFFRCSLPTAMSISRSEILRKKKRKKEVEKLMGDHGRSMGGHVRSVGVAIARCSLPTLSQNNSEI